MCFPLRLLLLVCIYLNVFVSQIGIAIQSPLQSCSEEAGQPKICFIDNESYKKPYPINLQIQLNLRKIIRIEEERKSISVQLHMYSKWNDSGLSHSNATKM